MAIINKNRRIDLIDGDLSMSNLMFERSTPQALSPMSNTNSVVRTNITSAEPVLAASGQNQALTKPFSQLSSIEKEQLLFNR